MLDEREREEEKQKGQKQCCSICFFVSTVIGNRHIAPTSATSAIPAFPPSPPPSVRDSGSVESKSAVANVAEEETFTSERH
jgi:hypothetical protein|tara:strand:+ start:282 stop:524 length:243 start_codon:yes stop_codon:yes gene_type:complete